MYVKVIRICLVEAELAGAAKCEKFAPFWHHGPLNPVGQTQASFSRVRTPPFVQLAAGVVQFAPVQKGSSHLHLQPLASVTEP